MNIACTTCLESFIPKSDISSTPCGHVFHTDCIVRWLENSSQNNCSHCRKSCTKNQLIKLFFSEIQFSLQDSTTNELKLSLEVNELRIQLIQENQKNLKIEQVKLKLISETKRYCKKLTDEAKGQLISKCLFSTYLQFYHYGTSSRTVLIRFWKN